MKLVLRSALLAGVLAGLTGAVYAGSASSGALVPSVTVNTPTSTLVTLKASELAVLPQTTVTVPVGGVATTESGPTLASLLTYAGVQYNAQCKNDELRWWIEVTSSDASAVVLTAGEIDPGFGNKPAILSIAENGKFLTSSGPTLIVQNDSGARNLKHVSIVTVGRAPAQLADVTPACAATSLVSTPPAGSLQVNGAVANPTTYTFSQLQGMTQSSQTVSFLSGANPTTLSEQGPTLASIVAAAQPKFLSCDPDDKLRFYVEVTSSEDGYAALLSYAELDPAGDNDNSLASLVENGASQASVGPRVTAPGDIRGGRYVSGSAVVTIFRAPTELRIPSCATAGTKK
jgi:hypothetical protein